MENKIKIAYIITACFLVAFIILYYSKFYLRQDITVVKNADNIEPTSEIITEETIESRIDYDEFYKENPYLLKEPINDEIYGIIKQKHTKLGFKGEFKKGNNYDFYLKQYAKLLNNELQLTLDDKEKVYLKDYLYSPQTISKCDFYCFDMDNDEKPELVIENITDFVYVIKYEEENDRFIIWCSYEKFYARIFGSQEIGRERFDNLAWFSKLNKEGEDDYTVTFRYEGYSDYVGGINICYLVSLPESEEDSWLKKESCYSDGNIDYFRVTEEEFNELYSLYNVEGKGVEEVTYSYEELLSFK